MLLLVGLLSLWDLYIGHVLILILAFAQGVHKGLSLESESLASKLIRSSILKISKGIDAICQGLDAVLLLVGKLDVDQMLEVV